MSLNLLVDVSSPNKHGVNKNELFNTNGTLKTTKAIFPMISEHSQLKTCSIYLSRRKNSWYSFIQEWHNIHNETINLGAWIYRLMFHHQMNME
mgnify:CR=1 FL=1